MAHRRFREHQITGDILPLLSLPELKDMGVQLVGPRTQLLRSIAKLKRSYVNYQRNRPLWSGEEERYNNPCECLCDYASSCCCPDPPDKYSLTSSHVKLMHKVYPLGKALRLCSKGTRMKNIDLSLVVDVDSASNQTCLGGRDMVAIEHENKEDSVQIFLELGAGPNVSRMIRDAVEENQANQRGTAHGSTSDPLLLQSLLALASALLKVPAMCWRSQSAHLEPGPAFSFNWQSRPFLARKRKVAGMVTISERAQSTLSVRD